MRVRGTTCVLLVVAIASLSACGGDGSKTTPGGTTAAPTPVAGMTATDQRAVADVALRYLRGIVAKDWPAVCQTRSPTERRQLAATAGSCEQAFQKIEDSGTFKGAAAQFEGVRAGRVRYRDGLASVEILVPESSTPKTKLVAQRTGPKWFLVDVPDSRTP